MKADPPPTLNSISTVVDAEIRGSFERLGRGVARWPFTIILVCFMVTAGSGVALKMLFQQELDGEDLYTPPSAQSFKDEDYVVDTFGSPGQMVRVLVTRNVDLDKELDCKKRDLLRSNSDAKRVLMSYMDLYGLIANQTVASEGMVVKLEDVCHKPDARAVGCEVFSILGIWNYSRKSIEADDNLLETINNAVQKDTLASYWGIPLASTVVLGRNPIPGPCFGLVEVLQMTLFLQNDKVTVNGLTKDHESRAWNQKLVETVRNTWNSDELLAHAINHDATDIESQKSIDKDIRKLILGYVLIFVFSHIALFKNSPVFCKAHLATGSIISVVMAIITSYGLAQIFKIQVNLVVQTLPFLLLGLGMDDTFVIMGAYHSTDITMKVEDRMAETMARAGSSILVTTLTDAIAFAVGAYTELPALHDFAIYALLGIAFDFIYQVTFFSALVVLDSRRENCAIMGAPTCGIQFSGATPGAKAPASLHVSIPLESSVISVTINESPSSNGRNWKRKLIGAGEFDIEKPSIATRLAGDWLPKFTLHPIGSAVVGIIEVILLAGAVYGCTKVKMDFRYREWFVPDGSYLKSAFRVDETYFFGDQVLVTVFTREPTDGLDFFSHLHEYENMVSDLKNSKYVADLPPVNSWYDAYSNWLTLESQFMNELDMHGRVPNATAFTQSVQIFLENSAGATFRDSVVFGEKGITATQLICYTKQIVDGTFAVSTMDNLRRTVREAAPALDPGAYSGFFLFFDGFKLITKETIRNVIMAGAVVFIITTIILANIVAAALVTLMIALTDTMLFGFMWFAGLSFNTVTAINMVLAVGIAVDYSAHIAHSFLVLKGSRRERAEGALHHIGGEVIAGAFTTWLAVLVMGFAEHYIFTTFFKMFFAIVVTGVWHGLVVLPIMLSMIGPQSYGSHTN